MASLAPAPPAGSLTDYQQQRIRELRDEGSSLVGGVNGMPVIETVAGHLVAVSPAFPEGVRKRKELLRVTLLAGREQIG